MNLRLHKIDHPQASNNYRVIAEVDGADVEVGSIGTALHAGTQAVWSWGIDTVIPMRELESEGQGGNRKDCMRKFRAAWDRFCQDEGRLAEFLEAKRSAGRRAARG